MPARTILIVEDAEIWASALEMALERIPGATVFVASSGGEALHVLEGREVGALITDLNMPRMDGFELIEQVRRTGRHAGMPIIVVSGDTGAGTVQRLGALGVDAYFQKPCSPAAVREKVEHLFNARTS
jgi:CheY-like chemotaxis protein